MKLLREHGHGRLKTGFESSMHQQVDDDSFVRVAALLHRVAAMPRAAAMLGYIESPGGGPHRDPDNQWHVTLDEWPTDKYPPWAHGAGALC